MKNDLYEAVKTVIKELADKGGEHTQPSYIVDVRPSKYIFSGVEIKYFTEVEGESYLATATLRLQHVTYTPVGEDEAA